MTAERHSRALAASSLLALALPLTALGGALPAHAAGSTTPAPAAAATVPAATGGRGSLPVGQASYPVPAGAVFVAPQGSDANPGTQAAPKRSVQAAVAAAPSGGTVVLRAGVYHQGEVGIYKPVTVQNFPGEAVWFDGSSVVTGWSQTGSTWSAPWSTFWDHSTSFTAGKNDASFTNAQHPLAAWPDQVFVDGRQLDQVPLGGSIGAGQFAVDPANKRLVIGSDPNGHEVRASDRDRVVTVGSADVTVRGLGIRRYANSLPRKGVIFMARHNDKVSNVVIQDVATLGISMTSDGRTGSGTIDHVTIERPGLGGVDGMMFDGGTVSNSVIRNGNREAFNALPATAGVKVTRSRNVTLDNNQLVDNANSNGLWTDESTIGVTITRNRVTNSAADGFAGIQTELTSSGVVADNVISGQYRGIYVFDSNRLRVVNNTVSNSVVADISLDQDERRQATVAYGGQRDPRNPVPDPNNTWITGDVTVNNNVFGRDDRFSNVSLWVLDKNRKLPAGSMLTTFTGNLLEGKGPNSPTAVGWGRTDGTVDLVNDLDAWSRQVGRGWVNRTYASDLPIAQAQQIANGLTGAPLDADIARLIGQNAGSTHVGSFQQI